VVFPECTTSNGRGLLRFADAFKGLTSDIPVRGWNVWVMCVRQVVFLDRPIYTNVVIDMILQQRFVRRSRIPFRQAL
jgi:hypothetical protein